MKKALTETTPQTHRNTSTLKILMELLPQLQSNCATDVGEARPDLDGLLTVTPASPSGRNTRRD